VGSTGDKPISHLGEEGTQSEEIIITKWKQVTIEKNTQKKSLICVQQQSIKSKR